MVSIIKVDQIQNSSGTSGLSIDSNGYVKRPSLPRWKARSGPTTTAGYYGDAYIGCRVEDDPTGNYSTANLNFTCPVAGTYAVFGQALNYANVTSSIKLYVNGSSTQDLNGYTYTEGSTIGNTTINFMTYVDVSNVGDTLAIYCTGTNAWYSNGNDSYNFWGGFFIG